MARALDDGEARAELVVQDGGVQANRPTGTGADDDRGGITQNGYERGKGAAVTTRRLLFLGAGFSRPAKLPLASELFADVRKLLLQDYGADNSVEKDLQRYIEYRYRCFRETITPERADYEEFIGFLDMEHYLGLKGSDTWSTEGNESQLLIRQAIARVIHARTPEPSNIPDAYRRFVRQLTTTDWIWTFNYDTLLENALELEGIPYRLFPHRYSEIRGGDCVIDSEHSCEVVVLKLHGSVDWFSRAGYDEETAMVRDNPQIYPSGYRLKHPIFGQDAIVSPEPIVDGPRPEGDALARLYRVVEFEKVVAEPRLRCIPYILSPSTTKLLYATPLLDLWKGLGKAGGLNLSLGIVGYSLPRYDDYVTQALYHITQNYQRFGQDFELGGRRKTKVRIVDYQPTERSAADFRAKYGFLDPERTEMRLSSGFDDEAVDWLLR